MFEVHDWGLIDYQEALNRQMGLVEELFVARQSTSERQEQMPAQHKLIFCSHPHVVTLGRGTKPGDVFGWSGDIVEVSRGGRATYHGPSQLVIYPIVDLTRIGAAAENNVDLHKYLRALETAVVETLLEIGIKSEARTVKATDDSPSLTGVWVNDKKIASIGIAVKRGISYHGISLNVRRDPLAYQGINPCGFKSEIMTSIEEVSNKATDDDSQLKTIFYDHFLSIVIANFVMPADLTRSMTVITRP